MWDFRPPPRMEMRSPIGDELEAWLASPAEGEMTMPEQATSIPRDLEAHLIARAWEDDAFRQELLSSPKAVLARELAQLQPGATLPDGVEVRVVEETPSTHYLVLPANPLVESGEELTDADLEPVVAAGGRPASAHPEPNDPICNMN